jgi:hypothetical protein
MAPIAYRFVRRLNYSVTEALAVSGLILLTPISVYLSFIYKGDPALATFTLLTVSLMVARVDTAKPVQVDIFLALSMALALSFKHSFVLYMAPLAVAYVVSIAPLFGLRGTLMSLGRILGVGLISWPLLNIGIVLDLKNFLEFQKIQSVMSITEGATLFDALALLIKRVTHLQSGLGYILPLLFLCFPIVAPASPYRRMLLSIWGATVAAMVLVAFLVKLRQPEHLWVPFFVVVALFAAITIIELVRRSKTLGRTVGVAAFAIALLGCVGIWQQTLARPITVEIAEVLKSRFADRKIATGMPLPTVLQSRQAQDYELARVQKTADKYQVELPPIAQERIIPTDRANARFIVPLPNPMSGLEDAKDEDLIGVIRAFAWPPQKEDWTLDLWLADGVDIFVVSNLPYLTTETSSQMLRAFYQDLENRCEIAAEFKPRKPLFLERPSTILDCSSAISVSTQ